MADETTPPPPATEPVPVTIDGYPALQDEFTRTEKGTNVVFLHTTVDDGDHFQSRMLSGDAQIALATAKRTAAGKYPNFSQREIDVVQIREVRMSGAERVHRVRQK